jgi:hypothetical protein
MRSQAFHPLRRRHVVRGAHRVAAHLAQHAKPEPLQPVGQRRAHAGVILVVAGALNLQRLAVEKNPLSASKTAVRTPKLTRSASRGLAAGSSTVTIAE